MPPRELSTHPKGLRYVSAFSAPSCQRCGKCCLVNPNVFVTDDDRNRWRSEGRPDILRILDKDKATWARDHMVLSRDGSYTTYCPFLDREGVLYTCTIYETRPFICCNFPPGSTDLCPQPDFDSHPLVEQLHHIGTGST
jgi:Fe-S-cluster containining protein